MSGRKKSRILTSHILTGVRSAGELPSRKTPLIMHIAEKQQDMAKQFGIIFGCLLVGELLALVPGLNIPGSILGMLVLTAFLERGVVRPESIAPVCRFLIKNMAFFFVPPGVALMLYFDIIAAEWVPITVATVVSIFLVLVVTGRLYEFLHRYYKKHR